MLYTYWKKEKKKETCTLLSTEECSVWAGRMTQVIECLPSKRETLSSNASTTKSE
jgi:L-rhamnose mutarotase